MTHTNHEGANPPDPSLFKSTDELRAFVSPTNVSPTKANGPIPTNSWWGNLLSNNASGNLDPVYPSPYAVFINKVDASIACSYLFESMHKGPLNENGAISYYYFPKISNLIFTSSDMNAKFEVEDWDDLTVQIALKNGESYLRTVLALGQAFMTIEHYNLPIRLSSENGIESVNGMPVVGNAEFQGTQLGSDSGKLVVGLNNGQKWFIWWSGVSSSSMDFVYDKINKILKTQGKFCGVVQAAVFHSDDQLSTFEKYAGSYVNRGVVRCNDCHGFEYMWQIKRIGTVTSPALHFAMEHHRHILTIDSKMVPLILHSHTRGPMQAYTIEASQDLWRFQFPHSEEVELASCSQFHCPRDPKPDDIKDFHVVDVLMEEVLSPWSLPNSYYFKGKALQKYGTMCLLSAKLSSLDDAPILVDLAATALKKFKALLDDVGSNSCDYPLVYDEVYKGVITSEAFAKHDINVEFGNAVYNDHHYHYGYFITATSIAYYLDPSYMHTNVKLFEWISTLVRDVLNSSSNDEFFPRFRHFDWFLGHSYSHGVTCVVDGKDEESTSEEINCLYGCNLWAQVTENTKYELPLLL
ncbi:Aste57867_7873 [Aphanomyces stellatus]|uniref:glucan endo-1,3-beta-D-glucosidase n=1 Tax=Aphanomyces stellatus TaxID=120398 RepID=A0A485KIV9_9STRA|nr:hypothetical protein As57867_007843 [Aphanomyces stellatus]VFT84766.1 Aste57867_7873 [Aphanomyces stellatus]